MTKKPKVMITTRAAVQRINRALKPDLQSLKKARTQQAILYFAYHEVDLEAFGQELA